MRAGGGQAAQQAGQWRLWAVVVTSLTIILAGLLGLVGHSSAQSITVENPRPGSIGVEGVIPSAAPSRGATITTPRPGQVFTSNPITISGLCPTGLLVKVFSNNVFVGSAQCVGGSYSLQVDLFSGRNDLVVRVFDDLDQPGPDSEVVTVTLNDARFSPFGIPLISLTSNYARRGANPGETLTWPISISGGTSPYAISVDWGDGKTQDLISQATAGTFTLEHIYDNAGTYTVTIRASDQNGVSAFLQLVAVANGAVVAQPGDQDQQEKVVTRVLWEPAALLLPLIAIAFWLGRRYELAVIRKHLERE